MGYGENLILLTALFISFYLTQGKEDVSAGIRCYCNREECKSTGYTCISEANKCYSKLYTTAISTNSNKATTPPKDEHGCIDLVSHTDRAPTCDGEGDVLKMEQNAAFILCCSDSMCNYKEKQDIRVDIVDTPTESNEAKVDSQKRKGTDNSEELAQENYIFKAAVIAVPIAGGLILILLIIMAIRMLREDYQRRSETHGGLEKAQHFIEQHFTRKEYKPKSKLARNKHPATLNSESSTEKLLSTAVVPHTASTKHWTEAESHSNNTKSQLTPAQVHLIKSSQHPAKPSSSV